MLTKMGMQQDMSAESARGLKRQWHIVQYLLEGVYVSTKNIQDHLRELGIEAELRTIQRDLVMMERIFPLECRADSTPHGWRWKRMPGAVVTGMNMSQALILCLAQEQLQDVLSPTTLSELEPLFVKARMKVAAGREEAPAAFLGGVVGSIARATPVLGGLGKAAAGIGVGSTEVVEKAVRLRAAKDELIAVLREEGVADGFANGDMR